MSYVDLDPGNIIWQCYLSEWKSIKGSKKDMVVKLKALAEKANNDPNLTYHQKGGIRDRVKYQIESLSKPEEARSANMSEYMQERQKTGGKTTH